MAGNQTPNAAERQIIVFELGGTAYGVEIGAVQEIVLPGKTRPGTAVRQISEAAVKCTAKTAPVIDLRSRLGMPAFSGNGDSQRTVVINVHGQASVFWSTLLSKRGEYPNTQSGSRRCRSWTARHLV